MFVGSWQVDIARNVYNGRVGILSLFLDGGSQKVKFFNPESLQGEVSVNDYFIVRRIFAVRYGT